MKKDYTQQEEPESYQIDKCKPTGGRVLALSINDSVYSCVFFFLTGLHFFHVMVGLILLSLILWSSNFSYPKITSRYRLGYAVWAALGVVSLDDSCWVMNKIRYLQGKA